MLSISRFDFICIFRGDKNLKRFACKQNLFADASVYLLKEMDKIKRRQKLKKSI